MNVIELLRLYDRLTPELKESLRFALQLLVAAQEGFDKK
jgi:hypothetical protein